MGEGRGGEEGETGITDTLRCDVHGVRYLKVEHGGTTVVDLLWITIQLGLL